mmetsp:Transcript_7442/g.31548  ORF Transcript_7442/g.31548 Transcript_7442/m.31548 type:complete len:303 (+) Transcript_7442:71-979(+)
MQPLRMSRVSLLTIPSSALLVLDTADLRCLPRATLSACILSSSVASEVASNPVMLPRPFTCAVTALFAEVPGWSSSRSSWLSLAMTLMALFHSLSSCFPMSSFRLSVASFIPPLLPRGGGVGLSCDWSPELGERPLLFAIATIASGLRPGAAAVRAPARCVGTRRPPAFCLRRPPRRLGFGSSCTRSPPENWGRRVDWRWKMLVQRLLLEWFLNIPSGIGLLLELRLDACRSLISACLAGSGSMVAPFSCMMSDAREPRSLFGLRKSRMAGFTDAASSSGLPHLLPGLENCALPPWSTSRLT